jgi:hypothetical protein
LKWTRDHDIEFVPIALRRPRREKKGEEHFWLVDFDCLDKAFKDTYLTSSMRTIRASLIQECVPKLLRRVKSSRSKKKSTPESTRHAIKNGSQRLMTNFMTSRKEVSVVSPKAQQNTIMSSPSRKKKVVPSSFTSPSKKKKTTLSFTPRSKRTHNTCRKKNISKDNSKSSSILKFFPKKNSTTSATTRTTTSTRSKKEKEGHVINI